MCNLPFWTSHFQDSLFFLRTFFTTIAGGDEPAGSASGPAGQGSQKGTPTKSPAGTGGAAAATPAPVMTVNPTNLEELEPDPDLMIMFDEIEERGQNEETDSNADESTIRAQPTFFK